MSYRKEAKLPVVQSKEAAICAWCAFCVSREYYSSMVIEICVLDRKENVHPVSGIRYSHIRCEDKNRNYKCNSYLPSLMTRFLRLFGIRKPFYRNENEDLVR